MAANARAPNARDAWHVFNGHNKKVARDGPIRSKRALRQLRRQIRRDWAGIKNDHPERHTQLKLELCETIRQVPPAREEVGRATRFQEAVTEQRLEEGRDDPAYIYADLAWAQISLHTAIRRLLDVERRIGGAADFIRDHDLQELPALWYSIRDSSRRVAQFRQAEEQTPDGKARRLKRHAVNLQPKSLPGGRMWYGEIASGDATTISLWLSGDQHNTIVDRVVMKDVWFLDDIDIWIKDEVRRLRRLGASEDPFVKGPLEIAIMERLTATREANIVRMRAWQVIPELMYRIFMEYCPNKSTSDLMNYHIRMNRRNLNEKSRIPEPAIWHIFESLIKAGLVLEQGFVDDHGTESGPLPKQRWFDIVHLDIKPGNIFLGDYPQTDPEQLSEGFAMYPTVKLGDFGLSIYRRDVEKHFDLFPAEHLEKGTPGYFAPEQLLQYRGQEVELHWEKVDEDSREEKVKPAPVLNAKTNVWGVGITLMALMNINHHAGDLDFSQPPLTQYDERDPRLVPEFTPAANARYSYPLRSMVQSCVQYRQDERPTFHKLLADLRHLPVDYARGARYATRDTIPPGLALLAGLPNKKYALGMAMPA